MLLVVFTLELEMDYPSETSLYTVCLLYTSDAADEEDSVDLGGRRIIKNTGHEYFVIGCFHARARNGLSVWD